MAKKPKTNPKLPSSHPANRGAKPRVRVQAKTGAPVEGARAGIIEAMGGMNAKSQEASKAPAKPTKKAGSKTAIIAGLLTRKSGCTTADILEATGWPAVSVPQQARAAGLKLRKEKDGKTTRYWGSKAA